ncbi:Homeodomain-like protein [Mycena vulgaris]|nr:Homeodomain-like protein [Mycena vulgaris]
MARGNKKGISDETKQHVIWMSHNRKKQEDIARDLRICLSSVEKILARYRKESEGLHVPTLRVRGLPRALGAADIDFLVGLIQRTPDMYLHEMQAQLREVCNVDVCLWTIWTALRRRGYTRKRVSDQ